MELYSNLHLHLFVPAFTNPSPDQNLKNTLILSQLLHFSVSVKMFGIMFV